MKAETGNAFIVNIIARMVFEDRKVFFLVVRLNEFGYRFLPDDIGIGPNSDTIMVIDEGVS